MAVRINASGEYAKITSTQGLPGTQYTFCGWAKSTYRSGQYQYWGVDNSDGSYYNLLGYSATSSLSYIGRADYYYFTSPGTEVWHFWCIRTKTAGADIQGGIWRVGDAAMQWATASQYDFTPANFWLGSDALNEYMNAAFAHAKIWAAELTDAEVYQEMWSARPVRKANLHLWSPLINDTKDYSGNGRHWTEGGTLTYEDGPPVGWGASCGALFNPTTSNGTVTVTSPMAATADGVAPLVAVSYAGTITSTVEL